MAGKSDDSKNKKPDETQKMEKHFQEMKQKVHDYIARVKFDHTMKKLLKKDPIGVLWAADLGFASEAEVAEFLLWDLGA